jgi:hypothetical protein
MRYSIEFIHNRSVFFACGFGRSNRDPGIFDTMVREIIRGYFEDEGEAPRAIGPSPLIPDTVHIVDDMGRVLASWSLRQEYIERKRERSPV